MSSAMTTTTPPPPPFTPKGVLFDLDGTLLDFERYSHLALNDVFVKKNYKELRRAIGPDGVEEVDVVTWKIHGSIVGTTPRHWSNVILDAVPHGRDYFTPEEYADDFHREIVKYFGEIPLMTGALELVKELHARKIPMAIATSSVRESFEKKMKFHEEFLKYFDAVVCGDEIPRGKPAPDIFLEAAKRLSLKAEECVVVEDSHHGCEAGKKALSYVVGIPDGRLSYFSDDDDEEDEEEVNLPSSKRIKKSDPHEKYRAHADIILGSIREFPIDSLFPTASLTTE